MHLSTKVLSEVQSQILHGHQTELPSMDPVRIYRENDMFAADAVIHWRVQLEYVHGGTALTFYILSGSRVYDREQAEPA